MSTVVRGAPVPDVTGSCTRCDRRTVPGTKWRRATREQRAAWLQARVSGHGGRGLCKSCYQWALTNDRLVDYERKNQRTVDVLEEWVHLSDPLRPMREEVRRLAPRLGMTPNTLDSALHRAGVRSRYEGGYGERVKVA